MSSKIPVNAKPAGIAVEGFGKALVSSKIPVNTAIGYAPIFVGGILNAMADVDLQLMFHTGTKALVGRFTEEKKREILVLRRFL